jgi:hypothetical protein
MASSFVFGGIFADGPSGATAVLVGFTGLVGGAGRYGAILVKRNESEVEWATAVGFFGGLAVGSIALLIESVL